MARTARVVLACRTPAGFDHGRFAQGIANRLAARTTHRSDVRSETPPAAAVGHVRADASFPDVDEAQQFYEWLITRLGGTGGPTGTVSYHLCSHALDEEATEPCHLSPGYVRSTG